MSRKILGLDIRHDSVTAVMMGTSMKGSWIENALSLPISDSVEAVEGLTSTLETIIQKIDISGTICLVSLPADLISFRNIQVPFSEKKKIDQILPFELEPMLPLPVEDLIIDFHILKLSDKTDRSDLLTASIQKAELKCYTDTLSALNIHPKRITIGGYSPVIYMTFMSQTPDQWLYMDIDNRHATVIGISSGQVCIARTFPLNAEASGMPRIRTICTGLEQTLIGFREMLPLAFQPEAAYVTGTSIENTNIDEHIQHILECPVQKINLIEDGNIGFRNGSATPWRPAQMDNALSLALVEIEGIHSLNFRKGPFAEKNFWIEYKKRITRTGILAALVLISMLAFFLFDWIYIQQTIHQIDQQIDGAFKATFPEAKNIVGATLQFKQMEVKLKELREKNLISTETGATVRAIDVLNQISKSIPNEIDVQFTRLVIGDGNVQITGDTDTLISVDNMKSRLEATPIFKEITITSANREQSSNRVRFRLKAQL